jgi:predicted DCC family thiol-disulfide oxidoreductase YuxK
MISSMNASGPIVLFDGICGLCDASVRYIIDHDPAGRFRFAPLQSKVGRRLNVAHGIDPAAMSSMVLIDDGRAYVRSSAAVQIARRLRRRSLSLLSWIGVTIPPPLRDALYDWVARNRYRWFGQLDTCRRPTPDDARRFLA